MSKTAGALGRSFLDRLFALATPGEIELRTRQPATDDWSSSTWHKTPAAAAAAAARHDASGLEVFVGVGRRVDRAKGNEGVLELTAAWADIDPSKAARIDNDLWHEERVAARERILAHQPPPSIIISSGQGLQCYWLLEEPADPELVREVNLALARRLEADQGACDPARVLRLPGSRHRKGPEPLPVGEIWTCTYALHRIENLPGGVSKGLRRGSGGASGAAPREYPPQPALLARVLERADGAREGTGGKVTHRCVFHQTAIGSEDTRTSAVVFPNGWYWCSSCGTSQPPRVWAVRPEVEPWDVAGLVVVALVPERGALLPEGFVKAPRTAIKCVGPLLANRYPVLMPAKRNELEIKLLKRSGESEPFENAADLGNALRQLYGPLVHRAFWACLVKAQVDDRAGRNRGSFKISVEQLGDALGCPRMADGRHHAEMRIKLRWALDALAYTDVTFRWSPSTPWERGPVIARRGDISTGDERYIVHDGIWKQLSSQSPAWASWDAAALRLDDEGLALYLLARWALRDRKVPALGLLQLDLADTATRAGVWNGERFALTRGRYLDEWRRRLARVHGLGLSLDLSGREPTLLVRNVVKPAAGAEQLLLGMAEPEPPARPLSHDLPVPISESIAVPRGCAPAFCATRTTPLRDTYHAGSGCHNPPAAAAETDDDNAPDGDG